MIYWISVYLLRGFTKLFLRGKVYGRDYLPKKGAYIGVVNHNSNMDVIAMSLVVNRKVHTMAKDSLFKVPVLKWWLKAVGMFPVVRNASDRKAFSNAIELLESGKILFMAPEGTRKKQDGQRNRPKTGFVRLFQITDVPVVPVAIYGTDKILPPGKFLPRLTQVKVKIGKPRKLEKVEVRIKNKEKLQQQADEVMDEIYRMLNNLQK